MLTAGNMDKLTCTTGAFCGMPPAPAPGSMPPMVSPIAAAPAATEVTDGAWPIAAATCSSASLRCSS